MGDLIKYSLLLFQLHLSATLRSRRTLVCAVLAAIPPLIAFLGLRFGPDEPPERFFAAITVWFSLQLVVPLVSLIAGSAVVTEEIENRTVTYLFSRPIPRASLLVGRWLAALVWVSVLVAASSAAVAALCINASGAEEGLGFYLPTVVAAVVGSALYTLLFAVLGVFLRRPMIVGLGYVFAFEGLVANLPGSTQQLALQHHLRSIAIDPAITVWSRVGPPVLVDLQSPAAAATTLLVVALIAGAAGIVGVSRRQYVLRA